MKNMIYKVIPIFFTCLLCNLISLTILAEEITSNKNNVITKNSTEASLDLPQYEAHLIKIATALKNPEVLIIDCYNTIFASSLEEKLLESLSGFDDPNKSPLGNFIIHKDLTGINITKHSSTLALPKEMLLYNLSTETNILIDAHGSEPVKINFSPIFDEDNTRWILFVTQPKNATLDNESNSNLFKALLENSKIELSYWLSLYDNIAFSLVANNPERQTQTILDQALFSLNSITQEKKLTRETIKKLKKFKLQIKSTSVLGRRTVFNNKDSKAIKQTISVVNKIIRKEFSNSKSIRLLKKSLIRLNLIKQKLIAKDLENSDPNSKMNITTIRFNQLRQIEWQDMEKIVFDYRNDILAEKITEETVDSYLENLKTTLAKDLLKTIAKI